MNSAEFRKELVKLMPGYKWKVHQPERCIDAIAGRKVLKATGTQSSGFNRTSTMQVERECRSGEPVFYGAKIADYGRGAPWSFFGHGNTLAQALRDLQRQCELEANRCKAMAERIDSARATAPESNPIKSARSDS
jgi:hypothetical protein